MGGGGPSINIPQSYNNGNFTGAQTSAMKGLGSLGNNPFVGGANSLYGSTMPYAGSTANMGNISSGANSLAGLNSNSFGAFPGVANLSGMNGMSPLNSYMQGSAMQGAGGLNSGAGSLMNASFNPQTGLFNQEFNNMSQGMNASLAARGLNQSGAGAQMYGNAMNQFLNNWSQQQIGNMSAGLSGANSAMGGAQSLLGNAGSVPLNQMLSGLSGYQGGLGNAGNLLSGLNLMPNSAASQIAGYGGNALNAGWGSTINQQNLLNTIFNNSQNSINSQNGLAQNMTKMATDQAQGNKAGIGKGIGGLMNLGGTLGYGALRGGMGGGGGGAGGLAGLSGLSSGFGPVGSGLTTSTAFGAPLLMMPALA